MFCYCFGVWFRFSGLKNVRSITLDNSRCGCGQLKAERPEMTQEAIAGEVGCSRVNVTKALNVTLVQQCGTKVTLPAHIKDRHHQADFRKLSPDLQSQIISRSISLNRACILLGNAIPPIVIPDLDNQ